MSNRPSVRQSLERLYDDVHGLIAPKIGPLQMAVRTLFGRLELVEAELEQVRLANEVLAARVTSLEARADEETPES